jgi:hypothetical protein
MDEEKTASRQLLQAKCSKEKGTFLKVKETKW